MAAREVFVDPDANFLLPEGAKLFTNLISAGESNDKAEDLFHFLCSLGTRAQCDHDPSLADSSLRVAAAAVAFRNYRIGTVLRGLERRLKQRLNAADAALLYLAEALNRPLPKSWGLKRLSLNQFCERLHPSDDVANFRQRCIRPTIPGLHLAIAAQFLLCHIERQVGSPIWQYLVSDRSAVRLTLEYAMHLEEMLVEHGIFDIGAESLIRFRRVSDSRS